MAPFCESPVEIVFREGTYYERRNYLPGQGFVLERWRCALPFAGGADPAGPCRRSRSWCNPVVIAIVIARGAMLSC